MTYKLEDEEPFQSYPKPGLKKKSSKIKNKSPRLHDIEKPKDTYCRFCGQQDDGTAYWHHCEVPYLKIKYGSGIGKKINDNLTAWGHHKCGSEMSKHPVIDSDITCFLMPHSGIVDSQYIMEWEHNWLMAIIESHLV